MVQELIVYLIILLAITRVGIGVYRMLFNENQDSSACGACSKNCGACQIHSLALNKKV